MRVNGLFQATRQAALLLFWAGHSRNWTDGRLQAQRPMAV